MRGFGPELDTGTGSTCVATKQRVMSSNQTKNEVLLLGKLGDILEMTTSTAGVLGLCSEKEPV